MRTLHDIDLSNGKKRALKIFSNQEQRIEYSSFFSLIVDRPILCFYVFIVNNKIIVCSNFSVQFISEDRVQIFALIFPYNDPTVQVLVGAQ